MSDRDFKPDHSASDDFGTGRFRKVEDANEYIGVLRGQRDRLRAEVERTLGDVRAGAVVLAAVQGENERLRETMREAAGHLCMTQCPAYTDSGVCAGGCYSEPSCQTDEPTEGWITAAIDLLVPEEDESPLPVDEEDSPHV